MNRIIAIVHDPADAQNRCSGWLSRAGYDVEFVCPAVGDAIPALDSSVAGAVVFGGRYDVPMKDELAFLRDEMAFIESVLGRGLPYLGLCLGGQLLAHVLGESVGLHPEGHVEYGYYDLKPAPGGENFVGQGGMKVLQAHWQGWFETPRGAHHLAYTESFPQQAFRYGENVYGLQFHPEATGATLERWLGRRPPERHRLPGAHPPERQRQDHLAHDAALGTWFDAFLSRWIGAPRPLEEAAE